MAERRVVGKERAPAANYDILESEAGPDEVYVDGYVGQAITPSVIKTGFYSVIGVENEDDVLVEQRLVKIRVVMPTVNFMEMCANTLRTLATRGADVEGMLDQHRSQISKILSEVASGEPTKEE